MEEYETALPAGGSAAHVALEDHRTSPLVRVHHALHVHPTIIPAFILLLSVLLFSAVVGGRFFAPFNLSLILQQVTIIGTIGIAQTLIVLTAGIDLSVGAIMVLASIIMGRIAVAYGLPVELAFAAGLLVGIVAGGLNGALITLFRLPPFIVTLGTWSVYFALVLYTSNSETIRSTDIAVTAPFLQWTGNSIDVFGAQITYGSLLMLLMTVAAWYLLNWSAFGTHIKATGDDSDAARLAGIRVTRTLLATYSLAGFICALAGWILIGRTGAISPQSGYTSNLDSITAVVIGGTSLFGGRGSIWGTLLGALIVGVFRNGLALAGVDVLWQEFTVGVLIIVAVAIDQWIRQASA
ncbi:MAG TPA: ABC transporter permease [Acetobacteraceae bacterium]|nr:ABC transporter permease [Acetobacteraceae bacterium]